jgi:glycosyltransferase involved in cell wall biosynthesis
MAGAGGDAVTRPLRLLTVGHSYVVGTNRALPEAIARVSGGRWEVTVAAPDAFPGDLGPIALRAEPGERCRLAAVPVHGAARIHLMRYGRPLKRLLADEWDVVHCWEEPFVLAAAQVARWTPRRTPLVFASFQNILKRYPPPFGAIERYAMRRAAGWIAFGQTVRETLAQRPHYPDLPHVVIPPGIDLARFTPDPAAGARIHAGLGWEEDGPPVIGFLGRFVPAKGWDILTRVLDALDSPWRALFVGGGVDEPRLRAWADRQPERARVVTGVPHDSVPSYLNAMDVLCAPSRTTAAWREQFGRMIVEAFACGVPVIASRSGEIPHVVGDAGILVDESDEAAWAAALAPLLATPAVRRALGDRGRQRAVERFDSDAVARRHAEFFEQLIAGAAGSRSA